METLAIRSSMLASASYDADARELRVTFKNGSTYLYSDVPQEAVDDLSGAESQGGHFIQNIRDAYQARRV